MGAVCGLTGLAAGYAPLAAITRDPRFGALAARALGARRIQLLQDSMLYKPAHDGGTVEWHQDYTYVGFVTPPRVLAIRIALCAEDEANGCMRVVDGSHRWGPVGDVRALRETRVDSLLPSLTPAQAAALATARPLALAAGDVSVHHCLTLHGSPPNRSDGGADDHPPDVRTADCRLDPARSACRRRSPFPHRSRRSSRRPLRSRWFTTSRDRPRDATV